MDKQVNHRVKEALIKIKGILNECGIETKTCTWDPWYKGIDDYCLYKRSVITAAMTDWRHKKEEKLWKQII